MLTKILERGIPLAIIRKGDLSYSLRWGLQGFTVMETQNPSYNWIWAVENDFCLLLGTFFGLNLHIADVDQFFIN